MRYSLVSRFKGTLLGGVLGESLAKGKATKYSGNYTNFHDAIIPSAESLIKLGKLDLDHWQTSYQKEFISAPVISDVKTKPIFATIPLALFFMKPS